MCLQEDARPSFRTVLQARRKKCKPSGKIHQKNTSDETLCVFCVTSKFFSIMGHQLVWILLYCKGTLRDTCTQKHRVAQPSQICHVDFNSSNMCSAFVCVYIYIYSYVFLIHVRLQTYNVTFPTNEHHTCDEGLVPLALAFFRRRLTANKTHRCDIP